MNNPDFLIIGAAKSGTTSLYYYLSQHPEIYMSSRKEPAYFAFANQKVDFQGPGDYRLNTKVVTDGEAYRQLFQAAEPTQKTGEASVVYLYHPHAAQRIYTHSPQTKLIAILRNPAERAVSNYQFLCTTGYEPCPTMAEALEQEQNRIAANWQYIWHYTSLGYYTAQLQRYYDYFPTEQLLIIKHEDLRDAPDEVLPQVLKFLEVDDKFKVDTDHQYNRSGKVRSRRLHQMFVEPKWFKNIYRASLPNPLRRTIRRQVMDWNITTQRQPVASETIAQLYNIYHDEVISLQDMLGIDLSNWLKAPADDIVSRKTDSAQVK